MIESDTLLDRLIQLERRVDAIAALAERSSKPKGKRRAKEPWPEYERFAAAVAKCREIEAKYSLAIWAHGVAEATLPEEYRRAVADWEEARIEVNASIEGRRKAGIE